MNNAVFGKAMENLRQHRDIKFVTAERRTDYFVSEPNYYTTLFFTEHLFAIKMEKKRKKEILMNKPLYLELSMLELGKILMYGLYDYVKPAYRKKAKLCDMDTDSFIVYIKTHGIYKDIAEDIETRFDTANYELECNPIERSLPNGKNKKVIGLSKNKISGKIMKNLLD